MSQLVQHKKIFFRFFNAAPELNKASTIHGDISGISSVYNSTISGNYLTKMELYHLNQLIKDKTCIPGRELTPKYPLLLQNSYHKCRIFKKKKKKISHLFSHTSSF